MIELIRTEFAAQGPDADLRRVVAMTLHSPYRPGAASTGDPSLEAATFIRAQAELHNRFRRFAGGIPVAATREYEAGLGKPRWQVTAHEPIPLVEGDTGLSVIPFQEFDRADETRPATPAEGLEVPMAIGFYLTAYSPEVALDTPQVVMPWAMVADRKLGNTRQEAPARLEYPEFFVIPAMVENRERFEEFLGDLEQLGPA